MPGLQDWFDVFRCGTHTDRFGREVTISRQDIDRAISAYQKDSAPIVIGHPSLNAPAFGWIGAFRRVGDVVQAKASSVSDDFADLVQKHMYKNRSLSFGPGPRFRHVGFLGAVPPAVKGLRDIQFSNEEEIMEVEFSESITTTAPPAPAPAEQSAEVSAPQEPTSEQAAPAPEQGATSAQPEEAGETEDAPPKQTSDNDFMAKLAELEEQVRTAKATVKQLEERNAKLQAECQTTSRELRRTEFAKFADNVIFCGKFSEDKRDDLLEFMEYLHEQNTFEFSEGTMPVIDRFKALFDSHRLPPGLYSEFAKAEDAPPIDPTELAIKAREYIDAEALQGRKVSATQAIEYIQKG